MHSNYISNKPTVPLQNCRCKGISYCKQINTVKLVEKSYYNCAIFFLQFPCIDYIIKSENLKEYKILKTKIVNIGAFFSRKLPYTYTCTFSLLKEYSK